MRILSTLTRRIPRGGTIAILWALAALSFADGSWQWLSCEDPAFTCAAPAGWQISCVSGRGARLTSPEGGPIVEVVAWEALHLPATPEKAAAEHEGVLGRIVSYRRDGTEAITTNTGLRGLLVGGRVRAHGISQASAFVAFASGQTHWVIGIFGSEEQIERLQRELLEPIASSFLPGVAEAPASAPPSVVLTGAGTAEETEQSPPPPMDEPPPHDGQPAPDSPPPDERPAAAQEPQVQPSAEAAADLPPPVTGGAELPSTRGQPSTPEPAAEPEPTSQPRTTDEDREIEPVVDAREETPPPPAPSPSEPWVQRLDPRGFKLSTPASWRIDVGAGIITAREPRAGGGRVWIWPLVGVTPGAQMLEDLVRRLPGLDLAGSALSADEAGELAVLDTLTSDGSRLVATWSARDGHGLLVAGASPGGTGLQTLARIASSFEPGEWIVPEVGIQEIVGDRRLISWQVPEGWETTGGARREGDDTYIDVTVSEPGAGGVRLSWQQPLWPRFRSLTPLLESLGWEEGDRYSMPENGRGLLIYQRRQPGELVRELIIPRDPRALSNVEMEERGTMGAIAGLLTGPDAEGSLLVVRGDSAAGPRERLYLAATARSRAPLTATTWEAAILSADAPAGSLPEAVAQLQRLVRTCAPTAAGTATGEALPALIERAKRALAAIPPEMVGAATSAARPRSVFEIAGQGGRGWSAPAVALAWWRERAN